jgi:hypothetical protein
METHISQIIIIFSGIMIFTDSKIEILTWFSFWKEAIKRYNTSKELRVQGQISDYSLIYNNCNLIYNKLYYNCHNSTLIFLLIHQGSY